MSRYAKLKLVFAWGFIGALLAVGVAVGSGQEQSAQRGNRVVVIHADGQKTTVSTNLSTVDEVLDGAGIEVGEHDAVEPSLDTEIQTNMFSVNVYRARPVTIVDGSRTFTTVSPYESPRLIAESVGLKVYDQDEFEFERIDDEILQQGTLGQRLVVKRATPVTINLYGNLILHRTQATTVAELLEEEGITLKPKDELNLTPETPIKPGLVLAISRFGTKVVTKREVIAAPVTTIRDANLPVGTERVRQEGSSGLRIVTYEVTIKNGKPAGRKVMQSVVQKQPVERIVVVGTYIDLSATAGGVWAQLRACEAGGDYTKNSGNGYYGAYQFSQGTWNSMGTSYAFAHQAPPEVQDDAARRLQARSGWGQWPACAARLGLLGSSR